MLALGAWACPSDGICIRPITITRQNKNHTSPSQSGW